MMKRLNLYIIFLFGLSIFAQEKLSLEECYGLVNKNYPLAKQNDLRSKQYKLDLAVINTAKLPKLDLSLQTTYQSEVTSLPVKIPNITIASPNKDQYKALVSVNQIIFDGGTIKAQADIKTSAYKSQQKQIEVSLYQLKKQINQLYFSILLLQEQRALLSAKKKQLKVKLKEVQAGIDIGTLLPTSDKVIEAELLKIEQQFIQVDQNKVSLLATLSKIIGYKISSETDLQNPEDITFQGNDINRPELDLFKLQKEQIETSKQLISKKNMPKIHGFINGGYGNPGLNFLDNAFQAYYIVGLKINWNVFDWNASRKERNSLEINKEIIDNQKELFELNTNIELSQERSEIDKFSEFIRSDETIINLRKNILKSAGSQLKNGIITTSAYITELTNLFEAENNLSTHKIQLLMAKSNYKITKGLP